jgi:Glyoxalase superfamily protein
MDISFGGVVPILRIFDIAKADEFYLGFLGFAVDWDHRFEPGLPPLYRQISRGSTGRSRAAASFCTSASTTATAAPAPVCA